MQLSVPAKCSIAGMLAVFGIAARILPHTPNFAPVTAIVLLASIYLGVRYSYVILALVLLVSDALIGFYSLPIMLAVYGSFALAGMIGWVTKKSILGILSGSLAASLAFFLITNYAVWQFGTMYEHSLAGLIQCYVMALPFFRASLAADLFYSTLFYGVIELSLRLVVILGFLARHTRRASKLSA